MKRLLYSCITLLATIVLLASCSSEKDGATCLKLIPEDAALIVRIDLKKVGEATNYANDNTSKEKLKAFLKEVGASEDLQKKLEAIIDSPDETGIDTENPIYLYVAPNMSNLVGLVGTTGNQDKLSELLEVAGKEAELDNKKEVDGMDCFAIEDAAIIVADDWFYIGMGGDDVKSRAKDLKELAEADKAPIMEQKDFKAMMEKKGLSQLLISGHGLDSFVGKLSMFGGDASQVEAILKEVLPGKLTDISLLIDADYSKGISTGTTELLTYSSKWEEAIANFDATMGNISPALAQYMSNDGVIALANLDCSKLLKFINDTVEKFGGDTSSEEFVTVSKILSAISGDMGMAFLSFKGDTPQGVAYISTKDATIIDIVTAEEDEDRIQNGVNDYTMVKYNYEWNDNTGDLEKTGINGVVNFGYKQGYTYFAFGKESQQPFTTPAATLPANRIKGKGLYFYMNYEFYNNFGPEGEDIMIMKDVANYFDYIEAYYEGKGKAVLYGEMKDKETPLLQIYINMFEKAFEQGYASGLGL